MLVLTLIKLSDCYPTFVNSDYNSDYNDDYYSEDIEQLKKSDVLKNMISSYIDNYFDEHRKPNNFDEDYQNDESVMQTHNDSGLTKLHKIGKLEENNNTIGNLYFPFLNTTLAKLINSTSAQQQTHQQTWNDNLSLKYKRQEINIDQQYNDRDKETRKNEIKKQILFLVGRTESSLDTSTPTNKLNSDTMPDFSDMFSKGTSKSFAINEKYQNFIPKCEIPRNTDEETWKDSTNMNLYFNINISSPREGYNLYIAKATLSLFRISPENLTQNENHSTKENSGDNSNLNFLEQEDRQIRVSIYWYTRSLKKHRVKRRLSDSKMIYVYDNKHFGEWIEFNIRPAAKSWLKTGRNLGLGVVIEDQEGTVLPANKYFKHLDCFNNNQASQTTASNNPKPQQIYDLHEILSTNHQQKSNDIDKPQHTVQHNRKHHEHRQHVLGSPTTTDAQSPIFSYLPTLRLCTIEIPANMDKSKINELKRNHCHYQFFDPLSININFESTTETLLQNDGPPLLAETTTHRTRHRNHRVEPREGTRPDPRDGIQNQMIVITNQQLIKLLEDMNSTSTETSINSR
ncbi:uncharacterized protein LOC123302135 isoform X2 [Chrysoperla carnea]|uniref:uncharacterized protein LOC123302135 isoform X2 n=1 Tax=Chrysoperla carnea TaxID=189513 RepID=UPI001D08D7E9|nr:uncharacterized protein LOC123302135 isoform X2 [Chrysoperla carnea]